MKTRWSVRRQALLAFAALTAACAAPEADDAETSQVLSLVREGTCENPNGLFPDNNPGPESLRGRRPIRPADLNTYVQDPNDAIALGKALFWDMQVGSDGVQACGSCHFRAGADPRHINQIAPGGVQDNVFDIAGPNGLLNEAMFPFHRVADPTNRQSAILQSFDDVVSSAGVKLFDYVASPVGQTRDTGTVVADPIHNVAGRNTRRVEPRNTPTVINAAFSRRTFWDGRADPIFNGRNEFGARDPNARVARIVNGQPQLVRVRITPGAMASQAVGPVSSDQEMSFRGRTFPRLARRLLAATPLALQDVAHDDSVLGRFSRSQSGVLRKGLNVNYEQLIRRAFRKQWWDPVNSIVVVSPNGTPSIAPRPNRPLNTNEFTMMEYNFSLFFGLAIQLYEDTLISDDAPLDRYMDGDLNALTAQQIRGLAVFDGEQAACSACHSGAETTNSSWRIIDGAIVDGVDQPGEVIERMFNGNCEVVIYDQSFYNIGVRPTFEDIGIGANDPFGNPLGIAGLLTADPNTIPSQELLTIAYPNIANPPPQRGERVSSQGAFKVPTLRNVALTAPYFHNGGQLTLRQVVEFYNRGGDFREANAQWVDFEIGRIGLTEAEIDDLTAFLEGALTDQRVLYARAPFDHPQLIVPNGHVGSQSNAPAAADGTAADILLNVPAVGRNGGAPLPGFLD